MNTINNAVLYSKENGENFVSFEIADKKYVAKVEKRSSGILGVIFFVKDARQVEFTLRKIKGNLGVIKKELKSLLLTVPVMTRPTQAGNYYAHFATRNNEMFFVLNRAQDKVLKRVNSAEFKTCAKGKKTKQNLLFEVFAEAMTMSTANPQKKATD